ncbi:NF038122 family metalloprotease [filamentous cyanobacterium LEGE 11480]|uniref:NF038122 family metalloprotease n=1 Tax=Romeriopsis navalis LEGE 11480 TaxID=2777977 RepID=A0A928VTH1_9CYAN|nr:NF038122 family metalloprotease [Romeriopsis navalis]MBE9033402.1 NF038122 family metalloprotease [Romeriopsis navalis LEGE 11480]
MSTQFKFTFDPGTNLNQMIGMEIAGHIWSQYLQDDITINIHVGSSSQLPTSVIGGALPAMKTGVAYSDFRQALSDDRISADDFSAVASLSSSSSQTVAFDWMDANAVDAEGVYLTTKDQAKVTREISELKLTNANAKALGLNTNGSNLDGYILMSSTAPWSYDFTRSQPVAANQLDYLSTAIHEVGHVIGFTSGIDDPGWLNVYSAFYGGNMDYYGEVISQRANQAMPLDFFRYNWERSTGNPDLSFGWYGGAKYLSLDGGVSGVATFSHGVDQGSGGDGEQASHWYGNEYNRGIMQPVLSLGERKEIDWRDTRAFDAIGWDMVNTGGATELNLTELMSQAKQSLAGRVGQTVTWLNNHHTNAANALSADRSADVESMVINSQVYEWGTGGDQFWQAYEWGFSGDPFWQRLVNLFAQRSLFSKVELPGGNSEPNSNKIISDNGLEIEWNVSIINTGNSSSNVMPAVESDFLNGDVVNVKTVDVKLAGAQDSTEKFELSTPKNWSLGIMEQPSDIERLTVQNISQVNQENVQSSV